VPEGKNTTMRCTDSYRINKNNIKMTLVHLISFTRLIEFTIKSNAQKKKMKTKRGKVLLIIKEKGLNKYKKVM